MMRWTVPIKRSRECRTAATGQLANRARLSPFCMESRAFRDVRRRLNRSIGKLFAQLPSPLASPKRLRLAVG
jgi:hypothetical protein